MNFQHLNRRLHLYLGLSLLPWFFVYGLSSVPFSHGRWIQKTFFEGTKDRMLRFERPYTIAVPSSGESREAGEKILADAGIPLAAFGTYTDNSGNFVVYRYSFRGSTTLTYSPARQTLRVEDSVFRLDHFLTGIHARGGFQQPFVLDRLWAVVVDVVCVGMLLWVTSGLYMWWHVKGHRRWGWLALAGGLAAFCFLIAGL